MTKEVTHAAYKLETIRDSLLYIFSVKRGLPLNGTSWAYNNADQGSTYWRRKTRKKEKVEWSKIEGIGRRTCTKLVFIKHLIETNQSEFVVTEYTLELRICIEWILKIKPVHTYLDYIN